MVDKSSKLLYYNNMKTAHYIDPETNGIHPLRHELTEMEIGEIIQGILDDKDWMSLEEIEAAQDYLFDHIAAKSQTVPGVTTLQ
jgi:hypothetical protein